GGRTVAVQLARAILEGLNHAPHGLVEEHADEPLQHRRAELEIDIEVDAAAAVRQRLEDPVVAEIAERPLCVGDIDPQVRSIELDPAGEALAHHLEANDEVSDHELRLPTADARADAPGQELRVAFDVGDQVE